MSEQSDRCEAVGLSAVVITLNEEKNIERCLEALRFADEIVVLDYPSMDEYARKMVSYARAGARQKMLDGGRFRLSDLGPKQGDDR